MIPDNALKRMCHRELPGGARQRIVTPNSPLSRLGEKGNAQYKRIVPIVV
jgi:hypothetical protein